MHVSAKTGYYRMQGDGCILSSKLVRHRPHTSPNRHYVVDLPPPEEESKMNYLMKCMLEQGGIIIIQRSRIYREQISNGPAELSAENAMKEMPASAPASMTELYRGTDFHELDTTGRAVDR